MAGKVATVTEFKRDVANGYDGTFDTWKLSAAFAPVVSDDCKVLYFFPYAGDDGCLHLWDVERGMNIVRRKRQKRGLPNDDGGYKPDEVLRRWPKLLELGQKEGFW